MTVNRYDQWITLVIICLLHSLSSQLAANVFDLIFTLPKKNSDPYELYVFANTDPVSLHILSNTQQVQHFDLEFETSINFFTETSPESQDPSITIRATTIHKVYSEGEEEPEKKPLESKMFYQVSNEYALEVRRLTRRVLEFITQQQYKDIAYVTHVTEPVKTFHSNEWSIRFKFKCSRNIIE